MDKKALNEIIDEQQAMIKLLAEAIDSLTQIIEYHGSRIEKLEIGKSATVLERVFDGDLSNM